MVGLSVFSLLLHPNKLKDHDLSWAAYHASVQPKMLDASAIIAALLPLFLKKADSPVMVTWFRSCKREHRLP